MKRILFYTIAILIGILLMTACEKTNNLTTKLSDNRFDKSLTDAQYNYEYISYIDSISGINIFDLINEPFFADYFFQLHNNNSYFINQIRNNLVDLDTFDYWIQSLLSFSDWNNENNPTTGYYHNYYNAVEHLSIIYFGTTALNTITYDGVSYQVALNIINSMGDVREVFEQNLYTQYPNFYTLSENLQDSILRIAIIIATYQEVCDCERNYNNRTGCESALESALNAAWEIYQKEYNRCRNKGKRSRCVHSAVARYEQARAEAYDEYYHCINNLD